MEQLNTTIDFTINDSNYQTVVQSFDRIARELFFNYSLKINDEMIEFIDLEFYFYSKNHPDTKTLSHKKETGELEAHRFGIDISLFRGEKNKDELYGGILIRAVRIKGKNELIKKSNLVLRRIFNTLKIGKNIVEFVEDKKTQKEILKIKRNLSSGYGDPAFSEAPYRFIIKDPSIIKLLNGKEKIIKETDLSQQEVVSLLGYKLSR